MANLDRISISRLITLAGLALILISLVGPVHKASCAQSNRIRRHNSSAVEPQPSWDGLKSQAENLYRAGKYDEAIRETELLRLMAGKWYGPKSLKMAEALGNLGALYQLTGREREGLALIKKARRIRNAHGIKGIPLGIQSEVFFTLTAKRKGRTASR